MNSAGFLAMCSEEKRLESGMKDLSILLLPALRRRICPCQGSHGVTQSLESGELC
jgi:hypothetical protein